MVEVGTGYILHVRSFHLPPPPIFKMNFSTTITDVAGGTKLIFHTDAFPDIFPIFLIQFPLSPLFISHLHLIFSPSPIPLWSFTLHNIYRRLHVLLRIAHNAGVSFPLYDGLALLGPGGWGGIITDKLVPPHFEGAPSGLLPIALYLVNTVVPEQRNINWSCLIFVPFKVASIQD